MAFTKENARILAHMMRSGHLGSKLHEAFLVLSGKQGYTDEIPQKAIHDLVMLELGRIETPTFMFSRDGGQLKDEAPMPVFILTRKGKMVAAELTEIPIKGKQRKDT